MRLICTRPKTFLGLAAVEYCSLTSEHAQIGAFKVVSEAGIASGVRRIEAVVGPAAVEYLNQIDGVVRSLASQFKVKYEDLPGRVAGVLLASFHLAWCGPQLCSTV